MLEKKVREISNFNQEWEWADVIFNCDLIGEGWKMNATCHVFIGGENVKGKYYLIT